MHLTSMNRPDPAPETSEDTVPVAPSSLTEALRLPSDACAAVEQLMLTLADDHLTGPLLAFAHEHISTGGKRIRARLALTAAHDLGVPYASASPWAAACELLHNASLIHDDIQDSDRTRRGAPALWVRHGVSQAINAGDALLMLPYAALGRCVPALIPSLVACLARRAALTACGQSLELALGDAVPISWRSFISVADGKSGQFFALPIEGACLLAGLPPAQATAIADASCALGILYQTLDDLLDLHDELRGNPEGHDVARGRVTALTCLHLDLYPADSPSLPGLSASPVTAPQLLRLLSQPNRDTLSHLARFARTQADALASDPSLLLAPPLRATLLSLSALFAQSIQSLASSLTALGRTP
jgi:geranylgeranyl diphosphate synthase, type I